jgi:hypothetical protein
MAFPLLAHVRFEAGVAPTHRQWRRSYLIGEMNERVPPRENAGYLYAASGWYPAQNWNRDPELCGLR